MVHQIKTPVVNKAQPSEPWQVTRRHAAPTPAELQEARQRAEGVRSKTTASPGSRFENRHAVQQEIIAQQRKLLKEQQEQISRLREKQNMMGLELEMEKTAQLTQLSVLRGSRPKSHNFDPREQRYARSISQRCKLCMRAYRIQSKTFKYLCHHTVISIFKAILRVHLSPKAVFMEGLKVVIKP